jgi:hypothetical protein
MGESYPEPDGSIYVVICNLYNHENITTRIKFWWNGYIGINMNDHKNYESFYKHINS